VMLGVDMDGAAGPEVDDESFPEIDFDMQVWAFSIEGSIGSQVQDLIYLASLFMPPLNSVWSHTSTGGGLRS
jgi:hypothetical protein